MSISEDVLRKRLDTDESRLKLNTLCSAYFKFAESVLNKEKKADVRGFLRDVMVLEFEIGRIQSIWATLEQDEGAYQDLHKERTENIKIISDDIEKLRTQLTEERKQRRFKEEYDALAKKINTYPPRQQSLDEIASLQQQEADLHIAITKLNEEVDLRSKQFRLLMNVIFDLRKGITAPEAEEKDSSHGVPMLVDGSNSKKKSKSKNKGDSKRKSPKRKRSPRSSSPRSHPKEKSRKKKRTSSTGRVRKRKRTS
eukprot:TRINITY_DN5186_c0_g1_i1.p1 TRINITY_DN5186_c0_g1~~TRINITY_DN5186_c0_g1_i1.p1  ORF type:complete len:254 (-),score=63.49 TRINITY_DN5186_c0_g1_i1:83-844(-)